VWRRRGYDGEKEEFIHDEEEKNLEGKNHLELA